MLLYFNNSKIKSMPSKPQYTLLGDTCVFTPYANIFNVISAKFSDKN